MTRLDADSRLPEIAAVLGLEFKTLADEYSKKHVHFVDDFTPQYFRFRRAVHNIEEGTVVFVGNPVTVVRGYPKIRRLMLLRAIDKHFKGRFVAEEKMNGYNVRTVLVDNKQLSITKGGIVCPYTTQHLEKNIPPAFFKENPHLMLCGEVVGLQNPYQMKNYPEAREFGYFVFDIRNRTTGEPLALDEKKAMLQKYALPAVHEFGVFTAKDAPRLLRTVKALGDENREGIVLKDLQMKQQAKYTSNASTNDDLKYAFGFVFDYGQSFFFRRLVREAFQAYELGLSQAELEKEAAELGKSVLLPMVETIKQIAENKEVTEDFDLTAPSEEAGRAFINHLHHLGVIATVQAVEKHEDGVLLKVKRHYPPTNDKIKAYLAGEFCNE